MPKITFELRLILSPTLKGQKIGIEYQDRKVVLGKMNKEIVMNLDFDPLADSIEILKVSGFKPDRYSHIKITNVHINGYQVDYFSELMSFDMKDNSYVENRHIDQVEMIDFNGSLNLETKKNIKRLQWFPMVFSRNRHGMIYRNDILTCIGKYGCFAESKDYCDHEEDYPIFDIDKFADKEYYDIVALGCSYTAGTGILKDQCWPSLLKSKGHAVLNLGVPQGGIDSILINTINVLQNQKKFKKLIILLPNITRRLARVKKHGITFNLLTGPNTQQQRSLYNNFNIYFSRDEFNDIIDKNVRRLLMRDPLRRNKKLIHRLVHKLESSGVEFKISSWADETYEILCSCVSPYNLLPKFNEEKDKDVGIDKTHPSEKIHQKWVNKIIPKL